MRLYLVSSKSVSNDRIFVSYRLEKLLETVCNLSDYKFISDTKYRIEKAEYGIESFK